MDDRTRPRDDGGELGKKWEAKKRNDAWCDACLLHTHLALSTNQPTI